VGAWKELLGDRRAHLVWTDPPYGVAYVGKTKAALTIQNDDLPDLQFRLFLEAAFRLALDHTLPGGAWYVASPSGPKSLQFALVLHELGVWRQTLQWVKNTFVLGHADYHYRNEQLFYGWRPGGSHYFVRDRTQDSVWHHRKPARNAVHPTMKPVGLVGRAILNSSRPGDLVVDPFAGSGTTLEAAHRHGRIAYLIEKDPAYCDVIRDRWDRLEALAGDRACVPA
jgi:site-specific DNA-methyltransferase (adenine-specific)